MRSVSDTEIVNWLEEWPILRMRRLIELFRQDDNEQENPKLSIWSFRRAAQALINFEDGADAKRVKQAFDMIAKVNTVTILSLDEMEKIVQRALLGEFDKDIENGL